MRLVALDALSESRDLLAEDLFLIGQTGLVRGELVLLTFENRLDFRIACRFGQSSRQFKLIGALELGPQPRTLGHKPELAKDEAAKLGLGGRVVETEHKLALLDEVSLLHKHSLLIAMIKTPLL